MIRRILGLGALVALLGPVSCLKDDGPDKFSTAGTCVRGDVEGCTCPKGVPGVHTCGPDNLFTAECRCLGCTIFPDCAQCRNTCKEKCLCQTSGKAAECEALCNADAGSNAADAGGSSQIR